MAKPSNSYTKNGGPSGPITELQLIRSNDLLYLGANKSRQENGVENPGNRNVNSKHPADENQNTGDDIDTAELENNLESEPMLPAEKKQDDSNRKSSPNVKVQSGEDDGLDKRESSLLEEMTKYLESNNVPVSEVK